MATMPQPNSIIHHTFCGAANHKTQDEHARQGFSFGNRRDLKVEDVDNNGSKLDKKFRSILTAELAPKHPMDEGKTSMPPSSVMIKLICVMTFRKLTRNPNTYSSLLGVVWSLISFK